MDCGGLVFDPVFPVDCEDITSRGKGLDNNATSVLRIPQLLLLFASHKKDNTTSNITVHPTMDLSIACHKKGFKALACHVIVLVMVGECMRWRVLCCAMPE